MNMKAGKMAGAVLLLGAAFVISGCAAAVVGAGVAGTVAYLKGDLEVVESKGIDAVYIAAKMAMGQLDLRVTEDGRDAMTAVITALDVEDKTVTIRLKWATENSTKLSIRVGIFGNERKSVRIYQKIHDNLK